MELKQRKVCGDCRVYSRIKKRCTIGYETKDGKIMHDVVIQTIPVEPCPKPLTAQQSIEAINNFRK